MSSNSDNITNLAENKVLILYLLSIINTEITQDNLFQITTSINNINYFYFKQIVTDLIESNLVATYKKDEDAVIKITSEGQKAYNLTKDVLPGIIKLKADNIFAKELSTIEEKSSIVAEFIPRNENEYIIKCKIVENNETIFEVKTYAGSRERAKRIVENWKQNATNIYPQMLNLLLQDNAKNEDSK